MASVSCSNCGKAYRVPDEAAGKKFQCKQCGAAVRVPAAAVAVGAGGSAGSARPSPAARPSQVQQVAVKPIAKSAAKPVAAKPRKIAAPPPVPAEAPADDGVDLDALASLEASGIPDNTIPMAATEVFAPAKIATVARPTARKSKASASKFQMPRLGFRITRIIIALLVGGGLLVFKGAQELMLASSASDAAQDITCADLGASGPGDNAHVRVTNFVSLSNYVYRKSESGGDWQTVWLPIAPPNLVKVPMFKKAKNPHLIPKDWVDSSQVHVLIKTHKVRGEGDVQDAMMRETVDGLVINKIEKLTDKERDLLREAYPLMDVDNVQIVEEDRKPQGGMGMMMLAGGIVLVLLGLAMMFRPIS
jgi:hypothetical protein